ncbi:MAG: Ldh family oxidoreductase [Bryobacteraceae bacterium]|nr:Ldh family oxidoreductase [Bryobacteraceae bacterium]
MSAYPGTEGEFRTSRESLQALVEAIFHRCGMPADHARRLAETLVAADLRGCHSHGVLRVPDYVRKLTVEGVDPRGEPRVVSERPGAIVVDGGNSMGQIGSVFAMRRAIEKAREQNVVAAAVRGSNHCGAMAYYAMMALAEGMIGIAATNALPTMAPWGGRDRLVGINPLAVAIPAGRNRPIVYDAAFSACSHGKIRIYHQKGLPLPEGWALDAEGRPTTDAAAALEGLLRPIGGYKGYSLALIFGILSAGLSGAAYGTRLGNMNDGPRPGVDGHFYMALNVGAFIDPAEFGRQVDEAIDEIRASRTAPGFDRIYLPGEIEAETEERYLREGIPLNEATLADLGATARSLGIATDLKTP